MRITTSVVVSLLLASCHAAAPTETLSTGSTRPATLESQHKDAPVVLQLDRYPASHIFTGNDIELPTRLRNTSTAPVECALLTLLCEYRPNEDGATLQSREQKVTLRPGESADLPARFTAPAPGPYEFRLTVSSGGQTLVQKESTLLYQPNKWTLPSLEPRDFDAFWKSTLAEMQSRPLDPQFAAAPGEKPAPAPFQEVSFNGFAGRRIRGYLGIPPQLKPGQKAPAILSLPSYSYHSAAADTKALEQGYICLALSIHDMPFGGETYRTHPKEHHFNEPYHEIGRQSKDTYYYRGAYVAGARAVEFLRSLPQVDPQKIIVMGMSQGGSLTMATAALSPDIALAEANVPGRSRMDLLTAPYRAHMSMTPPAGMTPQQMFENTLAYYDVSYFASRIRCPIVMRLSLDDQVNPGPLQYWAFLQIKQSPDARAVLTPHLKHQVPPDTAGHVAAMRTKYAPPNPSQQR